MDTDLLNQGQESHQGKDTTFEPPSVSLPKGGGAIRGIGEKFAANPVTGTGSMAVPIATSPGRSGLGPQLTLLYDSGAGNGIFGFGWNLSIPAITRKTDKGLPQYRDAEQSDVFLLSGAEDLVPVLELDGGRFVDNTSVPDYTIHRYRPRIEGLFARIERWTRQSDGDAHWRSISKDNILTIYGKDSNSRIADPENPEHIFSWLICETRDDKGNAVLYEYKVEDGVDVDIACAYERNRGDQNDLRRTANRYLKHIRYGNRISLLDNTGKRSCFLTDVQINNAGWMFEVVFDYDDHDVVSPKPRDGEATESSGVLKYPWKLRQDPFSNYRAGFEIRTVRLCQRVLMFHHFESEEGVGNDCLVRSTDFTYSHEQDPANARNPVYTFLCAVTQTGYKRQGDSYLKRSLPPVEFEYTQPMVQDVVEEVDASSLENLPVGLDDFVYQWTDLHGEGIPGILTEQAGTWFYKRNLSPISDQPVEFAPLEHVAAKPNLVLASGAQFMDLAGDGQPDLVVLDGSTPGLYEHDGKESWQPFRPFTSRINRNIRDPNLKFLDLDGDGRIDILITEDEAIVWHASLAEAGFSSALHAPQSWDGEKSPRLAFADSTQSIYLADLSGDGLTDLVRIRNGEVCYWPNLGYARFGAKVTMDQAPHFDHPDQFSQSRIRLADIDGTGTTDIIYLHSDGVQLYFNQSGNSWSEPQVLRVFPHVDDLVSIIPADLLGNGTACLVWSSSLPGDARTPMRYVNLMGGQKPHLLVKSVNNLGAETHVHYAPSTKFYLQDKRDGNPWITRLPFPVHVVERVETHDRISKNRFVSRYAYHHGYFDGIEREFRGFGMVEQWDTEEYASIEGSEDYLLSTNFSESSHMPPVHTKTWFHTGVYMGRIHASNFYAGLLDLHDRGEYFRESAWIADDAEATKYLLQDTILPDGLTADEEREACRALKGMMLRQEAYADDGTDRAEYPYTVTEQNFTVKPLQCRHGNRNAVFFTHAREAISYHYERNQEDPRTTHALTLEVDEFGNVLKSLAIGYGRRKDISPLEGEDKAKQERMLITYTENDVTNPVDLTGRQNDYRVPLLCEVHTYEVTGFELEEGKPRFGFGCFDENNFAVLRILSEIGYSEIPDVAIRQKRLIEQVRVLFRANDLSGPLALGELQSMAIPYESYKLAVTPELVSQIYRRTHDDGVEENLLLDPGRLLEVEAGYVHSEGDDNWWIPSGRVFYSTDIDDSQEEECEFARQHFFQPHRFLDPFGNSSILRYDSHHLLLQESRDALDNQVTVGERDVRGDLTLQGNDYRVLQAKIIMGPNRNRTAVAFDALGLVVGTAVMGKPGQLLGDSLDGFEPDLAEEIISEHIDNPLADPHSILGRAGTRMLYDLFAYYNSKDDPQPRPSVVYTMARETHDADLDAGQLTRVQHSFSYSDGFGREIQKKIQAEPEKINGTIGPPRWVGSGWTIFNNKGKPVRQYEPFFSELPLEEGHRYEFGVQIGVSPILFYDPVGRVVATLHPNHTWEKVIIDPWRQMMWDVNDTLNPLQTYDPLFPDELPGHSFDPVNDMDVGHYFERLPLQDYLPTWYDLRMDPVHAADEWTDAVMRNRERNVAVKAAKHASTPIVAYLDSLGRTFLTIADNGLDGEGREHKYETRVELDIEGKQLEVIDAKDRIVMRYEHEMLGSRIHQASMEAGERWGLNDVAGNPVRGWDSRGHVFRVEYDELRRPVRHYVQGAVPDEPPEGILYQRTEYGEEQTDDIALNLRTRPYCMYDGAGVVTNMGTDSETGHLEAYDFKGNLLRSNRRLVIDYKSPPNWNADPDLEEKQYSSSVLYDALNRPVALTTPDNSITRPYYNEANALDRIEVNLHGSATATSFVSNINYNARGQRTSIEYGNGAASHHQGVITTYTYDDLTFRLMNLKTTRPVLCDTGIATDLFTDLAIVQDLHYTYDPAGNITNKEKAALQTIIHGGQRVEPVNNYIYDALYRLIEAHGREHIGQSAFGFNPPGGNDRDYPFAGHQAHAHDLQALRNYTELYEYDAVGNFEVMGHRADGRNWTRQYSYEDESLIETGKQSNRLTGSRVGNGFSRSETFTYDAHGNMSTMPHLSLMDWNFMDQLQASARQVVNNGGTPETTYYVYDANGQRVRKVTERQASAGETPRINNERIYLGGFEIYREYNAEEELPTLERETLHVMDDQQRIALVETQTNSRGRDVDDTDEVVRFQLNDHLGSSSLELDENGCLISYEEYYPYGSTSYQATGNCVEVSAKRYRYTGMERDEETGLNYHGARYYAVWLGRWTATDPKKSELSKTLYHYSSNNPINLADPNGKEEGRQFFRGLLRGAVRVVTGGSSVEEIQQAYERGSSVTERVLLAAQEAYAPSRALREAEETYREERGRGQLEATLMSIDAATGVGAEFERIEGVYREHRGRGRLEATLEAADAANPISGIREAWVDTAEAIERGDAEAAGESFAGAYSGTAAVVASVAAPFARGTGISTPGRRRSSAEPETYLPSRAQEIHAEISQLPEVHEIGSTRLTVSVSQPNLPGDRLHLVHVTSDEAYRAIASGRVRLRQGEALGGRRLHLDELGGERLHVEELAAIEGDILGARGGLVGTSRPACFSCGGRFYYGRAFPGWGHVNPGSFDYSLFDADFFEWD